MSARPLPAARGAAFVAVITLLLVLCAAMIGGLARQIELRRQRTGEAARQSLERARDALLSWYGANLAQLDGPVDFPLAGPVALQRAGVGVRPPPQFAAGPLLDAPHLRYRPLALWLGGAPGSAGFDAFGQFAPPPGATAFLVFSSRSLEEDALARTRERLARLVWVFEARFATKVEQDPDHRLDRNWFRAPDGECRTGEDQLPCARELSPDGWPTVSALRAQSLVFASPADGGSPEVSAWGLPLCWNNEDDSSGTVAPPFSMAFSTLTPWGERLQVRAVQPL